MGVMAFRVRTAAAPGATAVAAGSFSATAAVAVGAPRASANMRMSLAVTAAPVATVESVLQGAQAVVAVPAPRTTGRRAATEPTADIKLPPSAWPPDGLVCSTSDQTIENA